jgi:hypothetical protein
MNCKLYPVLPPKVVAIATDKGLTPANAFPDPNLPGNNILRFGQDLSFGVGRAAPRGQDVGKTEAVLKPKMERLLTIFASQDRSGMAKRLFAKFLARQIAVTYFDDAALNAAAADHPNIRAFCAAALSAPGGHQAPGKIRIHQALQQANWDLRKLIAPTDLGVPAFNRGSKIWSTGDFANGLGLMINGVQYVYVIATHYHHDASQQTYCISLQFRFYDVFGLDDTDLNDFGAQSDGAFHTAAGVGITAWWQLQHQHGYAPLVTRIVLENTYEVPTSP